MSDVTVLPTGGTRGGDGGGVNWLLVGGAGVGVVILLVMMRGKGTGQPTTSAGSSINAALGSIQEQNLNIMGQVGQTRADVGQARASVSDEINHNDGQLAVELANLGHTIIGYQGGQGALTQATLAWMIDHNDPRVQQWLELYRQLNSENAGGIANVPTFP